MKTRLVWLPLVLVFGAIWTFSESVPLARQITVYQASCPTPRMDGTCPAGEKTARPTIYRPNADTETVVYWTEGDGPPQKFENCTIGDARNWASRSRRLDEEGEYPVEHQLSDGDDIPAVGSGRAILYQVPKYRYYLIKLEEALS